MQDLILLHPPSVFDFRTRDQFRGPIADVIPSTDQFDMYPLGLTSIAAYLAANSYRVQIVNLGRRMIADLAYDPVPHLRRLRARVFGISLHWLPHAQGALAVARLLKEFHPDSLILFGGLSASYYHEELARESAVDFVLRGDSTEEPVRQLMAAVREHRPLETVQNLTWKRPDGSVVVNELSYVPESLDAFDFPAYLHMVRSVVTHGHLADSLPYEGWWKRPLTVILNSRGCVLDCAVCGGSQSAYAAICRRRTPAYRSPERLIDDLRAIRSFSRSPVFIVHDVRMGGAARAARFLELLARERVPNELVFELFWPAGRDFFQAIAGSVERWSLQLTLDSQDERVRVLTGKFGSPNERIEETIASALEHGCRNIDVFFTVGLPGQTFDSSLGIADYCEHLMGRFGGDQRLRLFAAPIAPFLDPGSRAFEDPSLGYRSLARSLADHEAALLEPDWGRTLTYESDAMTRDEIVEATYVVTERINDLNLRYGLSSRATHDAVARGLRDARSTVASRKPPPQDATWMAAKDEMNWPGSEGIRPTFRLAWILFLGLFEDLRRALNRIAGRYDTRVAR